MAQATNSPVQLGSYLPGQPFKSQWSARYRGAAIQDMDRPQAVSIFPSETLENALEFANEHEFTYLPVVDTDRRTLMGYLPVRELEARLAESGRQQDKEQRREPVSAHMRRFQRRGKKYKAITMFTPLEELEEFFAGGFSGGQAQDFAVITDGGGLVYGVVTKDDLLEFLQRRPA